MGFVPPLSFKVATTLLAYRIVTHTTGTAWMVKYPAATSECPIGITTDTVLDTNCAIPVATSGIQKCYFVDSCASGQFVVSDSSGRGAPFTAASAGAYVIGSLVGPKVEDTGTIADILINPMWIDLP
jgi:hypothetical protein